MTNPLLAANTQNTFRFPDNISDSLSWNGRCVENFCNQVANVASKVFIFACKIAVFALIVLTCATMQILALAALIQSRAVCPPLFLVVLPHYTFISFVNTQIVAKLAESFFR